MAKIKQSLVECVGAPFNGPTVVCSILKMLLLSLGNMLHSCLVLFVALLSMTMFMPAVMGT